MSDSCPVKLCLQSADLTSQSFAEASQAPETKEFISGESDKLITSPVCPTKSLTCWPVSISHSAL